ncbi:MAG: hypothetical protein Ct9H300mP11_06420 [Chloroflexota bacterium]|nr:MAG: hypothetical protein Ct9H300mP11_06420 [Chloroflexota bacterium]
MKELAILRLDDQDQGPTTPSHPRTCVQRFPKRRLPNRCKRICTQTLLLGELQQLHGPDVSPPGIGTLGTDVSRRGFVCEPTKPEEYRAEIHLPACFYQTLRIYDREREFGFEVTDEQILAGLLMYQGKVVEMNSGEGKTIAAAFPIVLHAAQGRTVHVITANDYLAGRDAEWLAPVFESLGLSVGAVMEVMGESERRIAYGKSIIYGALREFGFDFMRDNLKLSSAEVVQRGLDVAVIDEVDHALIDEANIPIDHRGWRRCNP